MSTGDITLFGELDEKPETNNNIQMLYDEYVNEIHKLDTQIAELKGKREAYNEIRLDLFNELEKDKEQEE